MSSDRLTDQELSEVLRLDGEATEGPWEVKRFGSYWEVDDVTWFPVYPNGEDTSEGNYEDAHLIATYRSAAPRMARELVEARRLLKLWLQHSNGHTVPGLVPETCEALGGDD